MKLNALVKDYFQNRAIVKCPEGHEIDFYRNSSPNEFGLRIFVWCEECKRDYHILDTLLVKYRDKEEGELIQ